MADPEWKSLTPAWSDTVERLTNLVEGNLLDCLLSKGLVLQDQYESLRNSLRKKESKKDVVRDLLQILVKTPHPSFNKFWHLLDTEVEGGVGLRWQLFERRGTVPKAAAPHPSTSLIGVDHGRPEADGGHLQDQLGSYVATSNL